MAHLGIGRESSFLSFFFSAFLVACAIAFVETGQQFVEITHGFVKVFITDKISFDPKAFIFRSARSLDKSFFAVFILAESLAFGPSLQDQHV